MGNNQPIAYQQPHFVNGQQPQIVYPNGFAMPDQAQFPQAQNILPNSNYQEGHNNMANQANPIVLVPMPLDQVVRNNEMVLNQNIEEYVQFRPNNNNSDHNSFERRLSVSSCENIFEPINRRFTSGLDTVNYDNYTNRD